MGKLEVHTRRPRSVALLLAGAIFIGVGSFLSGCALNCNQYPETGYGSPAAGSDVADSAVNLDMQWRDRDSLYEDHSAMAEPPEELIPTVTVFYATDRNRTGELRAQGTAVSSDSAFESARKTYGGDRGTMAYGRATVTLPPDHRLGELERPLSLLLFSFSEDSLKHVMIHDVTSETKDGFFSKLGGQLSESPDPRVLVFVHEYKVPFADAIRRTAQMTYDLQFTGAPICYSWPAGDWYLQYWSAEDNSEWTAMHLKDFLVDLAQKTDTSRIVLIAHSMGCRALTRAIREAFFSMPDGCERFSEIILAAPDVDEDIFQEQVVPAFTRASCNVTLYASAKDKAMWLSSWLHGHGRIGDPGSSRDLSREIEIIDASKVDTDFVSHSYFAETTSVLSDIYKLLREGKRAAERLLLPVHSTAGTYYELTK